MFFDDDDEDQQQGQTGQGFDIEGGLVAGAFKAFFMIILVLFLAIVLAGFVGYKAAYAADYYTQCSTQWRFTCGFSAPGTGWDRLHANGYDPAASCPPGWTRMVQGPAHWAAMGLPPEVWNGITVTRYYCDNPSLPYPPAGLGG